MQLQRALQLKLGPGVLSKVRQAPNRSFNAVCDGLQRKNPGPEAKRLQTFVSRTHDPAMLGKSLVGRTTSVVELWRLFWLSTRVSNLSHLICRFHASRLPRSANVSLQVRLQSCCSLCSITIRISCALLDHVKQTNQDSISFCKAAALPTIL